MMKAPKVKINKTPWDTYIFSGLIVLASLLFVILNNVFNTNEPLYVFVSVENKIIDRLELTEQRQLKTYYKADYDVFLGDITIEIVDYKVKVEDETSPRKYCSIQGYVESVGLPIVCLPNSFIVVIMGESYGK
jgi:hypothetical protein